MVRSRAHTEVDIPLCERYGEFMEQWALDWLKEEHLCLWALTVPQRGHDHASRIG